MGATCESHPPPAKAKYEGREADCFDAIVGSLVCPFHLQLLPCRVLLCRTVAELCSVFENGVRRSVLFPSSASQ